MQNSNSNDGTKVPTSTNADATTSSQTIAKPNVKCSKTVRDEITRILYENSTDDSECMRIEFDKIQGVIDEIMLCVG